MAHGKWYYFVKSHSERAKTFGLTESFTEQEWESLLETSDKICACCKKTFAKIIISADHVIPLACGGTNTIDNIQILCKRCNSKKHAKAIDYRGLIPVAIDVKPLEARKPREPWLFFGSQTTCSLRIPIDTYDFFKEQSIKNKRSVNAEILIAIEERQDKIKKGFTVEKK